MRLIVAGVTAFLIGLGGSTGALVMRGKAALKAAADSANAHPDSTAAVHDTSAVGHDSLAAAHQNTIAVAARSTAESSRPRSTARDSTAAPLDSSAALAAKPLPEPPHPVQPAHVPPMVPPAAADLSYRQLARIFSNMKTTDAVKVLAYMSDDEVQGVLEELGVRQAAGLLAAFPKERAAALSRRLLHAAPKASGEKAAK